MVADGKTCIFKLITVVVEHECHHHVRSLLLEYAGTRHGWSSGKKYMYAKYKNESEFKFLSEETCRLFEEFTMDIARSLLHLLGGDVKLILNYSASTR